MAWLKEDTGSEVERIQGGDKNGEMIGERKTSEGKGGRRESRARKKNEAIKMLRRAQRERRERG